MALHALQKTIRRLFSRRRQQSPSRSPSGQPCAAAAGASELSDKVQGGLHHAAARGDLKRRRWYFKRGGINTRDQQRRTPLHLASANGHGDVVRHLAGKSCELNLADDIKELSLMKTVQCQQEECVAIPLEHGADPNLADADGNTALHLAVLSGNNAAAGLLLEHNASTDAQSQGGYTPLNLAVSKQHEEMLECLLKKAADRQASEQCESTACEVTTSHEADVEKDNLQLKEEFEKMEVELPEMEEKYVNSECQVQNLMAALEEEEREELAAVQELEAQLSSYLDKQATVKKLEENMQRLEMKNASMEATVHQQSKRLEALLRDAQASASLREMEEKYVNSERRVQNLMAALEEEEREEVAAVQELEAQLSSYLDKQATVKKLEENMQRLEMKNASMEATVHQQSKRLEALLRDAQASASLREMEEKYVNSERRVQNLMAALEEKERETTASALKLQAQLSVYLENVKQLEEHVQRLGFEKTRLEATVQEQSNMISALKRDLQATTSAQAVSEYFIKQSKASHHDSLTNQLKDRIRDLECELDRIKDTQQERTLQKQCIQAGVERYKELYLKEAKISKRQAKELERANERLEEANAKLLRERHKRKSLITSSIVTGSLAATPVLYSTSLGHLGKNSGLDRSLSLGGSFLSQCENILLSKKRIVNSVAKVQQELNEKITKELKEDPLRKPL